MSFFSKVAHYTVIQSKSGMLQKSTFQRSAHLGSCPQGEGEKEPSQNWTVFDKPSLITDLSKLFSHHQCFSAVTITLNEL